MGRIIRTISKDASVVCSAIEGKDIVSRIEEIHKTSAVVTAGLGCHTIPVRLWNPPELILLTLRSEGQERLSDCRERVPLQQGRMSAGKEEVHGTHRV